MIEADAAFENILAECATDDDLKFYLSKHAIIVQRLVCHMGKLLDHPESRIRTLYSNWADMVIEQLNDPRAFNVKTLH